MSQRPAVKGGDNFAFHIAIDKRDTHVHFRLFVGAKPGALGLAGTLCMRCDEFQAFQNRLDAYAVEQAWTALLEKS